MRIQILVDVGDGITLPINYNYQLAGIIYRFLAESDPEYPPSYTTKATRRQRNVSSFSPSRNSWRNADASPVRRSISVQR